MGKLTLLGLALMTVTSAFAGDNPSTVYVQNVDEKSQLPPVAIVPVSGELKCHFTQMTVCKPDETQAETRIA